MKQPRFTDLALERCKLQESPPEEAVAIKKSQEGQSKLSALILSDERILDEYPPDLMSAQITRRAFPSRSSGHSPWKSRWGNLRTAFPRLALATFAVVLIPFALLTFRETDSRVKGGTPYISVYKKSGESFERLGAEALVKERDVLQISYVAFRKRFGAIFSVDGKGVLTLHYPEVPGEAARLVPEGEVILPNAFELDSSPKFERFFFFTSQEPFHTNGIIRSFKPYGNSDSFDIQLPKSIRQFSVLLKK